MNPYSKQQQAGRKRPALTKRRKPNKYKAVRTTYAGIPFRSKLEADYAKFLDFMKHVTDPGMRVVEWSYEGAECKFDLVVEGTKIAQYTIDFKVLYGDGRIEYIETKGAVTRDFTQKWKLFKALYPDLNARIVKKVPKY